MFILPKTPKCNNIFSSIKYFINLSTFSLLEIDIHGRPKIDVSYLIIPLFIMPISELFIIDEISSALIIKIYSKRPYYVSENTLVSKAITIMNKKKITSLLCSSEEDYKKNKVNFKLKGIVHMHSAIKVQ